MHDFKLVEKTAVVYGEGCVFNHKQLPGQDRD
jgi:hypothetical protein